MKIAYITRARMPTEKAHGLQIAKMCEAYARLGHAVTLITPYRKNTVTENLFAYYGIPECFKVRIIPVLDTIRFAPFVPFFAYWVQALLFLYALRIEEISKSTLIMTRSFDVAYWYTKKGYRVVCEVHDFSPKKTWWHTFLLRRVSLLICNSKGTEETLLAHGLTQTIVAPNGVDLEAIRPKKTKQDMRTHCGIQDSAFLVMYIGALEEWKGYQTVLAASSLLPHVTFVIVGGKESQIKILRTQYPQVHFLGHQPYRDVGEYQNMADVLLVPNDPTYTSDQAHTSPIKLFTSLASRVPTIVTNLPNIRAVVGDDAVTFFDGSTKSLVEAIMYAESHYALLQKKAEIGLVLAREHSWQKRAERIMGAIAFP
jgi:glycosyltransferase involved in cell wall biosynthesis